MKSNLHARLVVNNGKLDFPSKPQETRFNTFLKEIPDGTAIDIFMGVSTDKGSNAQLARVHAMIRELAQYIGYTFEEMKLQITGLKIIISKIISSMPLIRNMRLL